MPFQGDLSTISLADVLQTLSATQKEGTLYVGDGETRRSIYFGRDGIRVGSRNRKKKHRIGETLLRRGKITREALDAALEAQKASGGRLGELLVSSGAVPQEEVDRVVQGQIEDDIFDLFTWKQANFEFDEGAGRPSRASPWTSGGSSSRWPAGWTSGA
jgi:hypothetical protein